MAGNTDAERRACVAAARAAGISQSDIDAFLRESPGDECRLNSAFAPTPGSGLPNAGVRVFDIPGLTSYSPGTASYAAGSPAALVQFPAWTATPIAPAVQPPASNPTPVSTVSANSVVTGPAIVAPPAVSADTPAAPASVPGALPSYMTAANYGGAPTAAPGAVMAPAATSTGVSPAPLSLAGVGGLDSKMLLLLAAAVVAYLVWGR